MAQRESKASTGTVVGGRYEVVCPISSGAMGMIFRRETDNGTGWRSSG